MIEATTLRVPARRADRVRRAAVGVGAALGLALTASGVVSGSLAPPAVLVLALLVGAAQQALP